jgi:hypothetical protein
MKRTRLWLVLLALVGLAQTASAQGSFRGLGIKTAFQVTGISGVQAGAFDIRDFNKVNWSAGVYGEWALGRGFSLLPSLQYSQKGAVLFTSTDLFDISLSYLALPVAVQYRWDNFTVEAGIENSVRLSGSASYIEGSPSPQWNRKYDMGVLVGLGYRLPRMRFGIRTTQGLLPQAGGLYRTNVNGMPAREIRFGRNRATELWVGVDLGQGPR